MHSVFVPYSDYNKLRKALSRKPIEGRILGVERVPYSRSLQVFNIGGISEDSLSAYFENTRRSGGSGVAEVRIKKQDNCAIVSFENHESKHLRVWFSK